MKLIVLITLFTLNTFAVYESDSRKDYYEVKNSLHKELMNSIAYRVYKDELRGWTFNRYWKIVTSPYKDWMCNGEKFREQSKMRDGCSAVLVGEDLLLTAGNCTTEHYCWNDLFYWVFDYRVESEGVSLNKIRNKNFYKCDKVLKRVYDPSTAMSFTLMKMKKKVIGRKPVKLSKKVLLNDDELITLGHVKGSPIKYSDGAKAYDQDDEFFLTNSDISGESKGSGVFNKKTGELEGILIHGTQNYYPNDSCFSLNKFSDEEARELVIKSNFIYENLKEFM